MREHESDSRSEDSGAESSSDHSDGENAPAFLDVEAAESSDSEGDENSSAGYNHDDDEVTHDNRGPRTFHPFMRLPVELRREIWDWFCPELCLKGQVLELVLGPCTELHAHTHKWPLTKRHWTAHDSRTLDTVTLPKRRLLAVHKESRALALQAFPHHFGLDASYGGAIIRFNRDVDLLLLSGYGNDINISGQYHLPDFDDIKQVAIDTALRFVPAVNLLKQFPSVERVFFALDTDTRRRRDFNWCVPDYVHEFHIETTEQAPGYGEDLETIICWPNVDEHKAFHDLYKKQHRILPEDVSEFQLQRMGIAYYPMAIFQFDGGIARFKALQSELASRPPGYRSESDRSLDNGSSASDLDSDSDSDGYESDGIDDGPIIEVDESSEDEDIPAHISVGSGSPSDTASPEPDTGSPPAQFSSPEPEDSHQPEMDREEASTSNGTTSQSRSLKRRIVSDSDDEEDEVDEPRTKRARTARGAVLDSDDEDQNEADGAPGPSTQQRRRQQIVLSDSEDGDEGTGTGVKVSNPRSDPSETEDDEESRTEDGEGSSEDDEDQDEEPSTKSMSLAERLRLHRRENPIPESDRDGSLATDEEESEAEDYDSEEDSEDGGGGLIDGMAAESDDDDDDDDDEEGYDEW